MTILPLFTLHLSSAAKQIPPSVFSPPEYADGAAGLLFWFPRHKKAAFQAALKHILFS